MVRAERRRERSMRGAWGDRGWWDICGCVERNGGKKGYRQGGKGLREMIKRRLLRRGGYSGVCRFEDGRGGCRR